jgi:glycerophosphoryl diester phosphodiesterase
LLVSQVSANWRTQLEAVDAIALHCNHRHLTPDLAAQVKLAGYGLFCYTVNEPDRARELLQWDVDAFCTDRIDLIGPGFI